MRRKIYEIKEIILETIEDIPKTTYEISKITGIPFVTTLNKLIELEKLGVVEKIILDNKKIYWRLKNV